MPIEFSRIHNHTIAVARCHGNLTEDDVLAAVDFAFRSGQLEPGLDNITFFDPQAQVHELDFAALTRIQQQELKEETRDGREPRFRSVLVASEFPHRPIVQLYKAIWDVHDFPGVEFFVVDQWDSALVMLDAARPASDLRA